MITRPGPVQSFGHMSGVMLARRAGIEFLHVPYKGAGPAITGLVSPADFVVYMKSETVKWADVVKASNIKLD